MPLGNSEADVPEGQSENSPAIHRWVEARMPNKSREGRKNERTAGPALDFSFAPSGAPSGLWSFSTRNPRLKPWAIIEMSLRTDSCRISERHYTYPENFNRSAQFLPTALIKGFSSTISRANPSRESC